MSTKNPGAADFRKNLKRICNHQLLPFKTKRYHMNTNNAVISFDSFSSPYFLIGKVEIKESARCSLTNEEIFNALKRHTSRDFGNVSWEHHVGNLASIAESCGGVVESIYLSHSGKKIYVRTALDDFEPGTIILIS